MTPKELAHHKAAKKRLEGVPSFHKAKSGPKLAKPFDKMRGPRMFSTGELSVSDVHRVYFFWRDGDLLTDSAFFGWLMKVMENGHLYPLFEFHYHPSHKGIHAKLPCKTELDYTQRQLPQAPEFQIKTESQHDPRTDVGRLALIDQFCTACGIETGPEGGLWN